LWKNTYIDEHAIQPAQVTLKYEWANVFAADRYLASLEEMAKRNASWSERSAWLQDSFAAAGLRTGEVKGDGVVGGATWAHVTPPRSAGTEVILLSANWNSRDEGENLRGIAMLLSLGEFLRGGFRIRNSCVADQQAKIIGLSTSSWWSARGTWKAWKDLCGIITVCSRD
jgi:glycosylphosphatidylinositol transamidase